MIIFKTEVEYNQEIEELTEENKKLKAALTILADPDNFENQCCGCSMENILQLDTLHDISLCEVAKEALKS